MRDPRFEQATASPPPEQADATDDDIAAVVSLDSWRQRASAPASPLQSRADARAGHPAQLWADARECGTRAAGRAATPS